VWLVVAGRCVCLRAHLRTTRRVLCHHLCFAREGGGGEPIGEEGGGRGEDRHPLLHGEGWWEEPGSMAGR
jgi:hypothetical protein